MDSELRPLGLRREDVTDFSANVNPLGASPRVKEALLNLDMSSYPDPQNWELREALADATGVGVEQIVPGNGSTELIYLLAHSRLKVGDTVVILAPTFGEYEAACELWGARVVPIVAEEEKEFGWDMAVACREVERLGPKLVFLCNPNNPTGVYLEERAVEALAEAVGGGLLAVDEAYISFVSGAWDATQLLTRGNVVLLRSMTKDYALTGLRLGYALCPEEIAQQICLYQPTWSVNAAAQAAGIASLSDQEHLLHGRRCVEEGRRFLEEELRSLGLRVLSSTANFMLVGVGDATSVRFRLLSKGVCVRDCSSFGLPHYVRIAVRTVGECQRLVSALRVVLGQD
ncbi:MAG: histidinol-phosphate transaminase [Chloroflexota bacterium]